VPRISRIVSQRTNTVSLDGRRKPSRKPQPACRSLLVGSLIVCPSCIGRCENKSMRKRIVGSSVIHGETADFEDRWLDLEKIATVEVTSEDPLCPVEKAFQSHSSIGWRASQDGEQQLRIIFDEPTTLHRMQLSFVEPEVERTQEFVIRYSSAQGGPKQDVVRQQWNFSPTGSTSEVERYDVNLERVSVLELSIRPNLNNQTGRASLASWRVG
jgi:hypothetical protein